MIEFMLAFIVLVAVVLAMSVGVLNGRKPISGSCGGLNNLGADGVCELCGGRPEACDDLDQNGDPNMDLSFEGNRNEHRHKDSGNNLKESEMEDKTCGRGISAVYYDAGS